MQTLSVRWTCIYYTCIFFFIIIKSKTQRITLGEYSFIPLEHKDSGFSFAAEEVLFSANLVSFNCNLLGSIVMFEFALELSENRSLIIFSTYYWEKIQKLRVVRSMYTVGKVVLMMTRPIERRFLVQRGRDADTRDAEERQLTAERKGQKCGSIFSVVSWPIRRRWRQSPEPLLAASLRKRACSKAPLFYYH